MNLYKYFVILFFLLPLSLSAQVTITGKVLIQGSKSPVADATIFLSQTRSGTKTDKDGTFALYSIKAGKYDVVVSCIGYEPYFGEVSIKYSDVKLPDIKLVPRVNQLAEVKIRPTKKIKRDWKRENQIRAFTDEFLGHTNNASQCKILNTELLIFEENQIEEKLRAKTNDFLIIENKALGYRIKYLLRSFLIDRLNMVISYTGSSVFEPLPGDAVQMAAWQNNRKITYNGSSMHFLRSCIADATSGNNFYVFGLNQNTVGGRLSDSLINVKIRELKAGGSSGRGGNSIEYYQKELARPKFEQWADEKALLTNDYVKLTDEKGVYALEYRKDLMVNYKHSRNGSNSRTTYITFLKPVILFDSNGVIFTPLNAVISGYWASLRVGDLLPVDYEPGR